MGMEDRDYYWDDRKRRADKYGIDDYLTKGDNPKKGSRRNSRINTKNKAYPEEEPYNYRKGRAETDSQKLQQETESQAQLNAANWQRTHRKPPRSTQTIPLRNRNKLPQWRKTAGQYIFFALIVMGAVYGFHQYRLHSQQHQQELEHEKFREQSCMFWTNHWDKYKDYRSYQKTKEYCD